MLNFPPMIQVRLSSEDLRKMIDDVSDKSNKGTGVDTVDLKTFIGIMENTAW